MHPGSPVDESVESAVSDLPPRASLGPKDRVIPTWTDPTVARASTLIGGPLGVHASVGRNRFLTPLRVILLFTLAVLVMGWLVKSPCIQTGANGQLDQSGERPWVTGCYNDIVPLYGSRNLTHPDTNPYAYTWVENGDDNPDGIVLPLSDVYEDGGVYYYSDGAVARAVGEWDLVRESGEPDQYYRAGTGELVPLVDLDSVTIRHLEYPVVSGYFMWMSASLASAYWNFTGRTHLLPQPIAVAVYFTVTAILLGLLYLWAVAATTSMSRRRIWDVAMMALAPLLIVHAFTNWDLLAIALTAGGMAAWSRQRPDARSAPAWALTAGVLLGLGAAAKLYPVLLLGPLLVLCLRAGVLRRFWLALTGAVVAWFAVNAPIMFRHPEAWGEFFRMNTLRGPEWDSAYFLSTVIAPTHSWWTGSDGHATRLLNIGSMMLFLAACLAIGWLALAARRRPRFAQLAFLVVAAFLLTNKVFSPQYALWLLPLVVLALPRWRLVLVWQLSEAAVWYLLMMSFSSDAVSKITIHPFAIAAVIRGALIITMAVVVIRDILRPERDRVRICGDDDPTGGVLDHQPDRFTLPGFGRRAVPAFAMAGSAAGSAESLAADPEGGPQPEGSGDGLS